MGLAASTRFVRRTEPTLLSFCGGAALTLSSRPMEEAKRAVSITVRSTPPFSTKACKCATPLQPSPGRMSSVESFFPTRLGVSGVFFQGSGLPHAVGSPLMTAVMLPPKPTGKQDDVVLGVQVVFYCHGLGADVVVGDLEEVEGLSPPAFRLRALPGVDERDAGGADGMSLHGGGVGQR